MPRIAPICVSATLALLVLGGPGIAAGQSLIADLNKQISSEAPQHLTVAGELVFFVGTDAAHGEELWVTDGTRNETFLLVDTVPGSASGMDFTRLQAVGNRLFFWVRNDNSGVDLWTSDGTSAGTHWIGDGGIRSTFGAVGNNLLFYKAGGPYTLWASNSSVGGQRQLTEQMGRITALSEGEQIAYFAVDSGRDGLEPWRTDGTRAGTFQLGDLRPGAEGSKPDEFTSLGRQTYFHALTADSSRWLWVSDGSPSGTVPLVELPALQQNNWDILAPGDSLLYFLVGPTPGQIWRSNGTVHGTRALSGDCLGVPGASIYRVIHDNSSLYVTVVNPDSGFGLWRIDLQDCTSRELVAFSGSDDSGRIGSITRAGRYVYFVQAGIGSTAEQTLWRTDGTAQGTQKVHEVGRYGEARAQITRLESSLIFVGVTEAGGGAIWRAIDGEVTRVLDIGDETGGSGFGPALQVGDRLFFRASDGVTGSELWTTDGSAAGTHLVADIVPGPNGSSPDRLILSNGDLYFTAYDSAHGAELWTSDGTQEGTYLMHDLWPGEASSRPRVLGALPGGLVVAAEGPGVGNELWAISDGISPTLLADMYPGEGSSSPHQLGIINQRVIFTAADGIHGREPWVSDGSRAGTKLLRDILPGTEHSHSSAGEAIGSVMVSFADNGVNGREVWVTDGTPAETRLLKDVNPGPDGSNPSGLSRVGGALYFSADDGIHGTEVWTTDGTEAGTRMLPEIWPDGARLGTISEFAGTDEKIFFGAHGPDSGPSLWSTDGASGGAVQLTESYPFRMVPHGDEVYFQADLGDKQVLWRSNGTRAGTAAVTDFHHSWHFILGDTVVLMGSRPGVNGDLWALDLSARPTVTERNRRAEGLRVIGPYPNPAADWTTLTVIAERPEVAEIAVFDILGRRIGKPLTHELTPGPNRIQLDLGTLVHGVYTYRLSTSNAVQMGQIVR